jgi:radical SAM-linked protein
LRIDLRLAIRGRARFLSHLETVDMLLAALRRAGYRVALSQGMRPKPVISLALARGVGIASEDEHCAVELVGDDLDPSEVAERLAATLPRGVEVLSADVAGPRTTVVAARYRIDFDAPPAIVSAAVACYHDLDEMEIERRSPKRTRRLDVKRYAPWIRVDGSSAEFELAILEDGSAKPEEVAGALARCVDAGLPVVAITRRAILTEPRAARVGALENL